MLKRPIEGTKGPAQTALLMITLQQIEEEEEEDISQLDILPPAWMLRHLELRKVRSLLACGRTTAWGSTWSSTLPRTMQKLIEAQRLKFQARRACPEPERGWTESQPLCSSPLCNAKTGLWLPSREEVGYGTRRHPEFSCGESIWGSVTIRSQIARHGPFVACCRDCGMLLKQMIRIRETQHEESVLLASRCRVAPDMAGRAGLPPSEYRLLSEMSASSGPSVPRSRSV